MVTKQETTFTNEVIETKNSHCPFCRDRVSESYVVACNSCSTLQHPECLHEHGSCTIHACEGMLFDIPEAPELGSVDISLLSLEARSAAEFVEELRLDSEWEQEQVLDEIEVLDLVNEERRAWMLLGTVITALFLGYQIGKMTETIETHVAIAIAAIVFVTVMSSIITKYFPRVYTTYRATNSTTSLWHDVIGNKGFDPVFGLGPPPRVQTEDDQFE